VVRPDSPLLRRVTLYACQERSQYSLRRWSCSLFGYDWDLSTHTFIVNEEEPDRSFGHLVAWVAKA